MRARWPILAAGLAIAGTIALWQSAQASLFAWDLSMHVPTGGVADSKRYRVFDRLVKVSPAEFELGGKRYRIKDAWLEHRTVPHRVSVFVTHQENLPELVLCVDLGRGNAQADVWFKNGKHEHTYYSGVNDTRMMEVGIAPPEKFTLCSWDGHLEAQFHLDEMPNHVPDPTVANTAPAGKEPRRP